MKRFLSILVVSILSAALAAAAEPGTAFNYAAYKSSSLKEIGDYTTKTGSVHEGGYEFFAVKYKVKVRLPGYPGKIAADIQKALQYHSKTLQLIKQEHLTILTHQLDLDDSGHAFTLVFQEQLVPFLKKEVRPGDDVYLYAMLVVYDCDHARTTMLVNEFEAVSK